MSYIIVGLGNPGEEYEKTRHNIGRVILEYFRKKNKFPDWGYNKKLDALESEMKIKKESVRLIEPETFMNKSGLSVKPLISSAKKALQLVVIHDDLDLPLGTIKISFNKGSGGHRGLESIMRAIKTKAFTRVRVGISPSTPSGKIRKPKGEKKVEDFILGTFRPSELLKLRSSVQKAGEALYIIVHEERILAMNKFN